MNQPKSPQTAQERAPVRPLTRVSVLLDELLSAAGCADCLGDDDLIADLGLDSMQLGMLVWSLADRLGVQLDLERMWLDELRTAAGIQAYFEQSCAERPAVHG